MEQEIADLLRRPPYEWYGEKQKKKIAQAVCAVATSLDGLNKEELKVVLKLVKALTYNHLAFFIHTIDKNNATTFQAAEIAHGTITMDKGKVILSTEAKKGKKQFA